MSSDTPEPWDAAQGFKVRPSGVCPYKLHFVEVKGDKIAYIDEGQGDPFLFVHGVPDSSHTWRNIIPHVLPIGRAIAIDLPGQGSSDKPRLKGYQDIYERFESFVDSLNLNNIIMVIIDWGTVFGMHYARTHEGKVKGIAMMEAPIAPHYPLDDPDKFAAVGGGSAIDFYRLMKSPAGEEIIVDNNAFPNSIFPLFVVRRMRQSELDVLRKAYTNPEDRWNLLMYPRMVPLDGEPKDTREIFLLNNEWMLSKKKKTPTLMIWFKPGCVIVEESAKWLASKVKNHESVYGGIGAHFVQEDEPDAIGYAIVDWHRRNFM